MLQESILQYFRPSLSYDLSLRPLFCLFLSSRLRQVLLYLVSIKRSTSVLSGEFEPCSSLSMMNFKVGVSCCVLSTNPLTSIHMLAAADRKFLAEAKVGLMPESLRVPHSPLMDTYDKGMLTIKSSTQSGQCLFYFGLWKV